MHDAELRAIYPDITDEERTDAAEAFDRYLALAWEIMQDAEADDRAP